MPFRSRAAPVHNRLRRAAFRENVSIPPKIRRQTWSDFCTCSRSSANTPASAGRAAKVRLHLLDQRQHRPERVVHVVRHAPRQIGHRVLALGGHHAGAERLGRCRFWMAIAACDRKCSTSSASNGLSCSG